MTLPHGLLPFKIELTPNPDPVTAKAGLPLVLRQAVSGQRSAISSDAR